MNHLLVTNDFPPKLGGIQSYLWELWRRLPPGETTILTTPFDWAAAWDAAQPFRVERTRASVLLPTPALRRRVLALADEIGAELVLLDPALPLGWLGPQLGRPYGVVVHGAEVTVPGRIPASKLALRHVVRRATFVVAAGGYPLAEAERAAGRGLPAVVVPPGVDTERFVPLDHAARVAARRRFGLPEHEAVVLGVSRLVPRKGFDVVIRASARLVSSHPHTLVIAGDGRDRSRLERIATEVGVPARFLGRVDDVDLPALYGAADVFAMACRNRWLGLEQEGFGIVFVEAAAAGVPQVAGASGGSAEAVDDGVTGYVVKDSSDVGAVADAIGSILADDEGRRRMGGAARRRAVEDFDYERLAARLHAALEGMRGKMHG